MSIAQPQFTVGIEEEYLLVDRQSRNLVSDPPPAMMQQLEDILGSQVSPEFLRSQIEIGTKVCNNIAEAREELIRLRRAVGGAADDFGYAIISASTHPFAQWQEQLTTDQERYNVLAADLQAVLRRLVICGMHVHVGINDPDLRIDLMNQVTYFLPHLYALTTSSPFWGGDETGLKSYRKSVFKALPRTGLPPEFTSWAEFERHIEALTGPGVIEDATKIWWDIRPSARYPTLELRVSDVCTEVEDSITVAALFMALLSMLYRQRTSNRRWRHYAPMLIEENLWRAQRYGTEAPLIDFGRGELVPYADLLEEIIDLVADDAEALGCVAEVTHARTIIERGTSADMQLAAYRNAVESGAEHHEGLVAVVDWLIEETIPAE